MSPPKFPWRLILLFSFGCARLVCADPDDSHAPKITPEEVLKYTEEHQPEWMRKITPGQQRLFFTAASWPEIIARTTQATGPSAAYKKLLFEDADRICASPIEAYHPPDPKNAQTLEEGWQRTFGTQMVVLAFAAKITPHSKYEQRMHDMVLAACNFETWGRAGAHGELMARFSGAIGTRKIITTSPWRAWVSPGWLFWTKSRRRRNGWPARPSISNARRNRWHPTAVPMREYLIGVTAGLI
jgi:hypothetical protein